MRDSPAALAAASSRLRIPEGAVISIVDGPWVSAADAEAKVEAKGVGLSSRV